MFVHPTDHESSDITWIKSWILTTLLLFLTKTNKCCFSIIFNWVLYTGHIHKARSIAGLAPEVLLIGYQQQYLSD